MKAPFKWESTQYESSAACGPNDLGGNVSLIAIRTNPQSKASYLTQEEMDELCVAWLLHSLDERQLAEMGRLLAAWGETPQGRRWHGRT